MKTLRVLTTLIVIAIILLLKPTPTQAHFGAVSFSNINGKPTLTNSIYQGSDKVTTAQDLAPEKYTVNQSLDFTIVKTALPFAPDVIERTNFRWSFSEGSTDYLYGWEAQHTYTKVGSFIASIDAKDPNGGNYVNINTIQINVVPDSNYQPPTVKIATIGKDYRVGVPITFQAQTKIDPNTKIDSYLWDSGDTTSKENSLTKTFQDDGDKIIPYPIFIRVTDGNGLFNDDLVFYRIAGQNVVLSNITSDKVPVVSDAPKAANSVSLPLVLLAVAAVLIIIVIVSWRLIRK